MMVLHEYKYNHTAMLIWFSFFVFIGLLLLLDLGVINRKNHVQSTKEASQWTGFWVSLALLFAGFIYIVYENGWVSNPEQLNGRAAVLKYLSGYLVEQSLSMDNIFVIALIFSYFRIPAAFQHRILFWGIIGALVFRAIMIGVGVLLIEQFSWIMYLFGGLLLFSAYQMWNSSTEGVDLKQNSTLKMVRRFFPVTTQFREDQFFIKKMGMNVATPLFVALIVVETTDVMFAFDSIPAIFAITTDPFLVLTSNIFAILGLRSLYFVLVSALDQFYYIKPALIFILFFIGIKMFLHDVLHIPTIISLVVIVLSLGAGIVASVFFNGKSLKPLNKN